MATLDTRREQMFPTLSAAEISRLRGFGQERHYKAGDALFVIGAVSPGMFVLVEGRVRVERRDPLGHIGDVTEAGRGHFIAEIGQLSGQPALVDVHCVTDVAALVIPPEDLRRLLIAETELGDRIMRALILRRVSLIETGDGGPVLIGPEGDRELVRLQGFLARNGYPHQVVDPEADQHAAALVEHYAPRAEDLPLVVCPDGTVLKRPSTGELGEILGMVEAGALDRTYDVAIVGAGPAGLATSVYAASEGLSVILFDRMAFGGQAGASARIENYLGFPTGISGQALAARAYIQAEKFGTHVQIPSEIARLVCAPSPFELRTAEGGCVRAATVVVSTGACYRRLNLPRLEEFEGRGIWYWASPIEARMCRREEVVLVGGGNSAGQAAVFLSGFASKVWMLVRGPGLAETMSQYLIDRIAAAPNIELLTRTELAALAGAPGGHLERVRWRHQPSGAETEKPIRNVFLFIGADPATDWLADCGVALDAKNFVRTGSSPEPPEFRHARSGAGPLPLESSIPGLFAIGDVRSGSVKRVGAAIGEGAAVVAQLHTVLARAAETAKAS